MIPLTPESKIALLEEQMRLIHQVLVGHQAALNGQQQDIQRLTELIDGLYNFKGKTQ
jgi:hypothetical protein